MAQADVIDSLTAKKNSSFTSPSVRDTALVLGGILIVTILIFLWATYVRDPKKKSSSSRRSEDLGKKVEKTIDEEGRQKVRVRRRRRSHRPRNPTLAETGGLPPEKQNSPTSSEKSNGEQNHNQEKRF
jgi:hypothetical protein